MADMQASGNLMQQIQEKFNLLIKFLMGQEEQIKSEDLLGVCDLIKDIAQLNIHRLELSPVPDEEVHQGQLDHYQDIVSDVEDIIEDIKEDLLDAGEEDLDVLDYLEDISTCFTLLESGPPQMPLS